MAWPFPDNRHTANACAETFNREQGCLGEWRKDVQITAGLLLLVAVVVFLLKVSHTVLIHGELVSPGKRDVDFDILVRHASLLPKPRSVLSF